MKKNRRKNRLKIRESRIFSEDIRKEVVNKLVSGSIKVSEASRLYEVSKQALYGWIYRYSAHHKPQFRKVMEKDSEGFRVTDLQKRIAELEQIVGRKQMQIDLLEKIIETASDELGVDLKKNSSIKRSKGSGNQK